MSQGFTDIRMKANPVKYPDKFENIKKGSFQKKIGKKQLPEANVRKLLGVTIHHKFNFNEYDKSLCKKTGQKLNTVANVILYEITSIKEDHF